MISKWRGHNKKDTRYQGIPERVLNAISSQQDASEKLVGWVQIAVVIFFGLLYAV
jgi:adenylate cyclase